MQSGQTGTGQFVGARLPRPEGSLLSALVGPPLRLAEWAFGLDEIDRMAEEVQQGGPRRAQTST